MPELCRAHPAFKALGLAAGGFPVDEQAKPFSMAERGGTILGFQLSEGCCQTDENQSLNGQ